MTNVGLLTDSDATQVRTGGNRMLGPYRLEQRLGGGGMGEVFSATDIRLHRKVAIKILTPSPIADPERRRRFLQEARAASALSHRNIVTLHDIANESGIEFLVMEHVEGTSLDKLIPPQGLPLGEVLDYAVQIASALAAAHAAGVVHRDIKPANIMITPDSEAKVVDFGIARLTPQRLDGEVAASDEPLLTEVGTVLGTNQYMSPEQARGDTVDARADLFSFGAVLYEMASGRRAYAQPLDWRQPTVAGLQKEFARIVCKLLEKNPEARYQSADSLLTDLKRLQSATDVRRRRRRQSLVLYVAGAALLALLAGTLTWMRTNRGPVPPDRWVQVTSFPDSVGQPSLSADGRMLTFIRGPGTFSTPGQVYVKTLPDGEAVRLTNDNTLKMHPMFSPDGSRIAYTVVNGSEWNTWDVSIVNAQARLWLTNVSGLTWRDGKALLYSEIKNNDIHMAIVTAEEDRARARDVYVPSSTRGMAHRSFVSPDGGWLLIVEMDRGNWLPCRLVPMDGTSAGHPVGPPNAGCTFAAWSADGRWMYVSSSAGGRSHIWRQRFPDGRLEQVTAGPTEEDGIAMTPDGRAFVTAVASRQAAVWLHDSNGEHQVSLEGFAIDPTLTPDGTMILYRILRGAQPTGPSELWVTELGTGRTRRLMSRISIAGLPAMAYALSADGREVVAAGRDQDGKRRLWLAPLDGQSPPTAIGQVEGDNPLFGPGGQVFFRGFEGESAFPFSVRRDGSLLRKIAETPIAGVKGLSPDSRWLIVRAPLDGLASGIVALPVDGGEPLRITAPGIVGGLGEATFRWSADGRELALLEPTDITSAAIEGKTFILPLRAGQSLPELPADGFRRDADVAALPDVRIIDAYDVSPGPTSETYAFSRVATQRNLYRVPIP